MLQSNEKKLRISILNWGGLSLVPDFVPPEGVKKDVEKYRNPQQVGLLGSYPVLEGAIEQGQKGPADDGYDHERTARLGKAAQVGHGQRPQGRPHQGATQGNEAHKINGKSSGDEDHGQGACQGNEGDDEQGGGLTQVTGNQGNAGQVTDHHA